MPAHTGSEHPCGQCACFPDPDGLKKGHPDHNPHANPTSGTQRPGRGEDFRCLRPPTLGDATTARDSELPAPPPPVTAIPRSRNIAIRPVRNVREEPCRCGLPFSGLSRSGCSCTPAALPRRHGHGPPPTVHDEPSHLQPPRINERRAVQPYVEGSRDTAAAGPGPTLASTERSLSLGLAGSSEATARAGRTQNDSAGFVM